MDVLETGHPLAMADTVFAQGEQKQTLTNNQSCQRKRDAVLHCVTLQYFTADKAIAPARWSFKIQSCIFRSSIFSAPFKHTKIARLHRCDVDNFKTLKTNYVLLIKTVVCI